MLSKKAKYAINSLVFLGKQPIGVPVLISEISTQENIPQKFLEAILLQLKKEGILDSKKGRGGGYFLRLSTSEINLADIVRIFDGAIALVPCVTYNYYEKCEECHDEVTCGIRKAFLHVRNTTVELLKDSTIEKIINNSI